MFETHDSWQKNYFLAQDEGYKSWHCFRLKNTRPWFLVRFIYIEDTQIHDQLFFSDVERLINFSEHPNIKILEVCVGSSPESNHTNSTQLSKLESIYSACNGSNRNLKFLLFELEGGKSFAYPAENYDEDLDDVNLIFTTLDHNPLDIPDR